VRSTAYKRKIRVVLVDDHLIVRQGICSSFRNNPLITMVSTAATGTEAISVVRKIVPDVVLMDINMPEMNGLEAAAIIRRNYPTTKVLALTVHDTREYVQQILQAGAQGYVLKDASTEEISRAIQAVHKGEAYFSPSIARIVLEDLLESKRRKKNGTGKEGLSGRESEVLKMIVKGRTTKEIAAQMIVGARTVETYRARLMRKLKVRNVAELTSTAIARQLVSA